MNKKLSIVICTHNCFTNKYSSIETTILSILNQRDVDFEIIIVDNLSDEYNRKRLENFLGSVKKGNQIKLIRNSVNNIAKGRNLGSYNSESETILFMDDDIILEKKDILKRIAFIANRSGYGYSAIRKWTEKGWYEEKRNELNERISKNEENYKIIKSEPDPEIRKKYSNRHLVRSYIGNFGFVQKTHLKEIGFWDESYVGYGIEDDDIMLKLYLHFGRPVLLSTIEIVHIWHRLNLNNYDQMKYNQEKFNNRNVKQKIRCFHSGRLLYNEKNVIEWIQEEDEK